jgi:glycylpeptide N-tetradecanoyltransferase
MNLWKNLPNKGLKNSKKNIRINSLFYKKILCRSRILPFEINFYDYNLEENSKIHDIFFFLDKNYIQDAKNHFRFNYIHEFLKNSLLSPCWNSSKNLGIRFQRNRKICGFVSAINRKLFYFNFYLPISEINFLCVKQNLRRRKLVTILIKEIARRQNLIGYLESIFTTGVSFGDFITKTNFYHLYLRKKNLIKFGFIPEKGMKKNFNLKLSNKHQGEVFGKTFFQKMYKKLFKSEMYNFFDLKACEYWFFTISGVFYRLTLFCRSNFNKIGFVTFFSLPTKFIKSKKKLYLLSAYSYYNVIPNSGMFSFLTGVIISKKLGFDLFNLISSNHDNIFLSFFGFRIGSGKLQYYITNIKYNKVKTSMYSLLFF